MARIRELSLIGFFAFILIPQVQAEVSLTKLVERIQPAIVTVKTYDVDNEPLYQGTGFFISSKGYLVTNYHVLKEAYSAEIITYDHKHYPIKSVVGENEKIDLIKVSVDIWPKQSVHWLKLTNILPSIAERVIVVGSPLGLDLTVSDGIVSAIRDIPNMGKVFQLTAPISKGSSGSPVVNMKGEVLGVASFMMMKGQNLNFAIPGKYVLDIKTDKNLNLSQLNTHAVDKKTSKYTSISPDIIKPKVNTRDACYIEDDNGVVYDKNTGLEWYAGPDEDKTWYEVKRWVESLNVAGGGWRMPTPKELKTLYNNRAMTPSTLLLLTTSGNWVWSGETRGSLSAWGCKGPGSGGWSDRDYGYNERGLAVRSRR